GNKDLRTRVQFLNGNLQVKQGIAMISHVLQVPIIPLRMKEVSGVYTLSAVERIDPGVWNDRREFIVYGMQSLYDRLEKKVAERPWIWECWGYLHQNGTFDPADLLSFREQLLGTEEAWIPIQWRGRIAYFDRVSYQLIR